MMKQSKPRDDHIKVVVRSRPLNEAEKAAKTPMLVTCDQESGQVNVTMNLGSKRSTKKYNYDMVFGQYSTQAEVYNAAIRPVVDEVLQGFNCTVFAYGQTGTGKTHTMEGDVDDPELMGMIPRAVSTIFESLEALDGAEYTVKVSFLELYNEELQDLLSVTDEVKLRILDDKSKMSTGVACHNLEEAHVSCTDDILNVMKIAMAKRQVGETKLNKASSRSHCIFTMTLHMRETTPEGEDLLKIGKLNLVDLAGSECIGRSGATNQRAREAGNINKSLLTLGRVISALVEKTPHIPYRDSKLTRLLQESLGGRAKTCIIATVAPSVQCLDETLSTLEYASRAKSIKNKPEANQRLTKRAMIKEYAEDLERLRQELASARAKDGVYISEERFNEMEATIESQRAQVEELEDLLDLRQKEFSELQDKFDLTVDELETVKADLAQTREELETTKAVLEETKAELERQIKIVEETRHLVKAHHHTETNLREQTASLQATLDEARGDVAGLQGKVRRKAAVEAQNDRTTKLYRENTVASLQAMSGEAAAFCKAQIAHHNTLGDSLRQMSTEHKQQTKALLEAIQELGDGAAADVRALADDLVPKLRDESFVHWDQAGQNATGHAEATRARLIEAAAAVDAPLKTLLETVLVEQDRKLAEHTEQVRAKLDASRADALAFADTHAQALEAISKKVAQDAEESRRALEAQSASVKAFVVAERERIEGATAGLIAQFTSLLTAFKTEAQTNLDGMLDKAQTACQAAVEGNLRAELQTKKVAQDAVSQTRTWCEAKAAATEALRAAVEADSQSMASEIVSARSEATAASQTLHAKIADLCGLADHGKDAQLATKGAARKAMQESSDALQASAANMVIVAGQRMAAASAGANGQEKASEAWSASRQTEAKEQAAAVSAFAGAHSIAAGELENKCNTLVDKDLVHDRPTGSTPRKKRFTFDPMVPQTSEHDDILGRYRAGDLSDLSRPGAAPCTAIPEEGSSPPRAAIPLAFPPAAPPCESKKRDQVDGYSDDGGENESRAGSSGSDPAEPPQARSSLSEISSRIFNEQPEADGSASISKKKTSLASRATSEDGDNEDDCSADGASVDGSDGVSRDSVLSMKVSQLRKELSSRSLSQLGNKATLQARLLESLALG